LRIQSPVLVIGTSAAGNPNTLANRRDIRLVQDPNLLGLWDATVPDTGLPDGIYHHWFQVENSNPSEPASAHIFCTDPFATTVNWRLLSPPLRDGFNNDTDRQPASVIRLLNGRLLAIDPGGETSSFQADVRPDTLPSNNYLFTRKSHFNAIEEFKGEIRCITAGLRMVAAGYCYWSRAFWPSVWNRDCHGRHHRLFQHSQGENSWREHGKGWLTNPGLIPAQ
jgi:hypothetical protein